MAEIIVPAIEAYWRYGQIRDGQTDWSDWAKNTICIGYGDLVGALLTYNQAGSTIPAGFQSAVYMAVGQGAIDGTWDYPNVVTPPTGNETQLVSEIGTGGRLVTTVRGFRQAAPPDGSIIAYSAAALLNRPIFTATWNTSFVAPNGLREVGLFAGIKRTTGENSTVTNGGRLLNLFRYPVQIKDSTDPYSLVWEVELNIKWS